MEVLDRIKRRFDGGDGDYVAKQTINKTISRGESQTGRMYKNDTHSRYPSRPLAGQAERDEEAAHNPPVKSNGSRDRKERKITSCWYCDKTAHGKLELTQPHSDSAHRNTGKKNRTTQRRHRQCGLAQRHRTRTSALQVQRWLDGHMHRQIITPNPNREIQHSLPIHSVLGK
eukprot:scaffold12470_cov107-Skeletonema_marinoi.AAC.1